MSVCVCGGSKVEGLNKNQSVLPTPLMGRQSENFLAGGVRPQMDHLWKKSSPTRAKVDVGKVLDLLAPCSAKSNIWLHSRLFWLVMAVLERKSLGCW